MHVFTSKINSLLWHSRKHTEILVLLTYLAICMCPMHKSLKSEYLTYSVLDAALQNGWDLCIHGHSSSSGRKEGRRSLNLKKKLSEKLRADRTGQCWVHTHLLIFCSKYQNLLHHGYWRIQFTPPSTSLTWSYSTWLVAKWKSLTWPVERAMYLRSSVEFIHWD